MGRKLAWHRHVPHAVDSSFRGNRNAGYPFLGRQLQADPCAISPIAPGQRDTRKRSSERAGPCSRTALQHSSTFFASLS